MQKVKRVFAVLVLLFGIVAPTMSLGTVAAQSLEDEPFTGDTLNGSWISGGNPTSACLTASTNTTTGIPGCNSSVAIDTSGNGTLRLTTNVARQAGFAIDQTPVSTSHGLQLSFDEYQYNATSITGADGIAFFLIDGSQSPTLPGAFGGSLGYASNNLGAAGLVGGYVGVGFDVYGNYSNPVYGNGGPSAVPNGIAVRGSQATNYQYITGKVAAGSLSNNGATTRSSAKRHVIISISTNNIMTVYVDYEDGAGPVRELSNINLNTINGANSLPASLKFGFSASTGGSNDIHEISNLSITTLSPSVSAVATQIGSFQQGKNGQFTIATSNDADAESTTDNITVTDTLPAGLQPTAASGTGWTCTISGQTISCTRPGDNADALTPGSSEPLITATVAISGTAASSLSNTTNTATTNNNSLNDTGLTNNFTIAAADPVSVNTIDPASPALGTATPSSTLTNTGMNLLLITTAATLLTALAVVLYRWRVRLHYRIYR